MHFQLFVDSCSKILHFYVSVLWDVITNTKKTISVSGNWKMIPSGTDKWKALTLSIFQPGKLFGRFASRGKYYNYYILYNNYCSCPRPEFQLITVTMWNAWYAIVHTWNLYNNKMIPGFYPFRQRPQIFPWFYTHTHTQTHTYMMETAPSWNDRRVMMCRSWEFSVLVSCLRAMRQCGTYRCFVQAQFENYR